MKKCFSNYYGSVTLLFSYQFEDYTWMEEKLRKFILNLDVSETLLPLTINSISICTTNILRRYPVTCVIIDDVLKPYRVNQSTLKLLSFWYFYLSSETTCATKTKEFCTMFVW